MNITITTLDDLYCEDCVHFKCEKDCKTGNCCLNNFDIDELNLRDRKNTICSRFKSLEGYNITQCLFSSFATYLYNMYTNNINKSLPTYNTPEKCIPISYSQLLLDESIKQVLQTLNDSN